MDRKVGQPNVRIEFFAILFFGVFGAIGHAYVGWQILTTRPEIDSLQFGVIGLVLEPVLGIVFLWAAYSIGLHLIADKAFQARGPLRRLLTLTAWALTPIAVGNLLRSAVIYLVFRDLEYRSILEEGQTAYLEPIDAVMKTGMSEPLYLLAPVITMLAILASGSLMVFAAQNAKDLSHHEASKAVALLVAVHILYILREVAINLGVLS